jgi:hypothetical protein
MAANLSSDPVRFRWFLLAVSWVVAAVGIGAVVQDRLDDGGSAGDQTIVSPDDETGSDDPTGTLAPSGTAAVPGDDPVLRPAAAQVVITGAITAVDLAGAELEPSEVPTPLTLVSERGFGNGGELTDVTVNGRASTIVWDGGRPFVLSSGPGLRLGAVTVQLVPGGLRLAMRGALHRLVPGTYRLNTPVAVGAAGIATPYDAVTFEATDDTRVAATGDTALVLGPTGAHRIVGRGAVHLEGDLAVEDASGSSAGSSFDLADGAYDLTFMPAAGGGWTVSGTADAA